MKIFDYTDGRKGRELGSLPLVSATNSSLVPGKNSDWIKLTPTREINGVMPTWHSGAIAGYDIEVDPSSYGVEAVCFCMGEVKMGDDTWWDWCIVSDINWARKAYANGWLTGE